MIVRSPIDCDDIAVRVSAHVLSSPGIHVADLECLAAGVIRSVSQMLRRIERDVFNNVAGLIVGANGRGLIVDDVILDPSGLVQNQMMRVNHLCHGIPLAVDTDPYTRRLRAAGKSAAIEAGHPGYVSSVCVDGGAAAPPVDVTLPRIIEEVNLLCVIESQNVADNRVIDSFFEGETGNQVVIGDKLGERTGIASPVKGQSVVIVAVCDQTLIGYMVARKFAGAVIHAVLTGSSCARVIVENTIFDCKERKAVEDCDRSNAGAASTSVNVFEQYVSELV